MGDKKIKWGESGGAKKAPTFSKTKKMGNLKKKKWARGGHINKNTVFAINVYAHIQNNVNMGENTPLPKSWRSKNKKKVGARWACAHFLKVGVPKKKRWARPPFF